MRKIDYTNKEKDIAKIKDDYYALFIKNIDNSLESNVDNYLKCFNKEYKLNVSFKYLLTSSFEELVDIEEKILFWSKKWSSPIDNSNCFNDLFIYTGDNQKKISHFFMTNFDFRICHYCDEHYISSFIDFKNDYIDYLDFLNKASLEELNLLNNISDIKAGTIIKHRENFEIKSDTKLLNINIQTLEKEYIKLLKSNTHNYFTLDHVLPQGKFPFFSLSLFNLVPSCYSCNSKFKNKNEFKLKNIKQVSPTSNAFDIDIKIKFSIISKFNTHGDNIITLQEIHDNFILQISPGSEDYVKDYLRLFKLNGRYLLYKEEINKLINKRINYPDSELNNISKLTGKSIEDLKKDIFGEDLFNNDSNIPLSKMKKDIAEFLEV